MITKEALSFGSEKLKQSSKTPNLDTEIILADLLKKPKEFIFAHPESKLTQNQKNRYELSILDRGKNKPVAYITGIKEFYGLNFFVNSNVLIPRPETEKLVEKSLKKIHSLSTLHSTPVTILDLGTGSGCIAIAIAKNTKVPVKVTATDVCKKTLKVAQKNAKHHQVKIKFIQSDLLKNIKKSHFALPSRASGDQGPDIIVANLPYITPKIYQSLALGITQYEPKKALLAKTRNYFYEKLRQELKNRNWHPILIFE